MTITVNAPDGSVVNFPDDTPVAVIESAMRKKFGGPTTTEPTPQAQPVVPEEGSGFLRQVADVPLQFGKGAVTGVRMIADAFGANSGVSQSLSGVENYIGDLMSAQSKNDAKRISEIMKEAEDKGLGAQVAAGLKALTVAPVDLVSNALGTSAPIIAGSLLAMFGAPATATAGTVGTVGALAGVGLGAATGAGAVKGSIYGIVKDELVNAGVPKDKAEAAAEQAQEYGGKNLDQILLGTVLGGVAGASGVESALIKGLASKITSKLAAQEAAELVAEEVPKGFVRRAAKSAAEEAVTEAPQEGQEQLAQNLALQREGFDVPTWRGVAGAATLGGALGALTGGIAGGVTGRTSTQPSEEVEDIGDVAPSIPKGGLGSADFNAKVAAYQLAGMTPEDAFARAAQEVEGAPSDVKPKPSEIGEAGRTGTGGPEPSVSTVGREDTAAGPAATTAGVEGKGLGVSGEPAKPAGGREVGIPSALSTKVIPPVLDMIGLPDMKARKSAARDIFTYVARTHPTFEGMDIDAGSISKAADRLARATAKAAKLTEEGFTPDVIDQWASDLDPITTLTSVMEGTKAKKPKVAAPAAVAPITTPVEEPVAAPVEEPVAAPVEEPAAAPVEEPIAAPAAAPAAAPVEEPAAPATPKITPPTPEQQQVATTFAKKKSGSVVYQNGSYGLVRGFRSDGAPVYYTFKDNNLSKEPISSPSWDASNFTPEETKELESVVSSTEAADIKRQVAEGPSISYDSEGLYFGPGVPAPLRGVIRGLKRLLLSSAKIYVGTLEDIDALQDSSLTGRHRGITTFKTRGDVSGVMRRLGDNEYAVAYNNKAVSLAKKIETLAHELGHVHMYHVFNNAAPEIKAALVAAHAAWQKRNKRGTAADIALATRARTTAKNFLKVTPNAEIGYFQDEDREYFLSFNEWYADNVARWATSSAKPLTVVEQFFARLGAAMRRMYTTLRKEGFLPHKTFSQFLNDITKDIDVSPVLKGETTPTPAAPTPVVAPTPAPTAKKVRKVFAPEEQAAYDALMQEVVDARRTNKISIDHFSKMKAALTTTPEKRLSVADLRSMLSDLKEEHFNRSEMQKDEPVIIQEARKAAAIKTKKIRKQTKAVIQSQDATDLNVSLGTLFKNARSFEDVIRLLKATYASLNVGSIGKILPTLTTDDITRWIGDELPFVKEVNNNVRDMARMRSKMIRDLAERMPSITEFLKKHKAGGRLLADVMHLATLSGFDPALYTSLKDALVNDPELADMRTKGARQGDITRRSNEIAEVWDKWSRLANFDKGKGHEIYEVMRDEYKKTFDLHQSILQDKINNSNLDKAGKAKVWAEITKNFQDTNKLGVYFPLMRYGRYWFRVGTGANSEYYMFETSVARNNALLKRKKELKAAGDLRDTVAGDNINSMRNELMQSSKMLKDMLSALDATNLTDPKAIEDLKDAVYQMYLMTLPDKDMRTRFAKRKGRIGFTADIARNFVVTQHTAANQLARLKYADTIRNLISAAEENVSTSPDKLKLDAFVREISLRAKSELESPSSDDFNWNQLASIGNKAVFYYMLTSPKSAIVQMTQLPVVGLPYLTSKYGAAAVLKMVGRYGNLYKTMGVEGPVLGVDGKPMLDDVGNPITKWGQPSIEKSTYINEHPDPAMRKALKAAWNHASDLDIFMSTYTGDMTARASKPTEMYTNPTNKALRFVSGIMSGSFHHMERITREIMYMSAFELEYNKLQADVKAGKLTADEAQAKAEDTAIEAVYDSLFNYTQYNKPRIMKAGPITKLAFQFMTYPLQMTSFLVRNFTSMLPYLNKEGKREAATQFFGVLGMVTMFAGVVGLPGYSMIMGLADGLRAALRPEDADDYDEDDEGNPLGKRSLDLWFRETFIPKYFGAGSDLAKAMGLTEEQSQLLQRMVKMGPISAISGLDIGSSVSLDSLFYHDNAPADTSKAAFEQMLLAGAFGPLGSMGSQMFSAADDFESGQFKRGVEKLLPAFFRGGAKALRFSSEGNLTPQGAEVRNAEWYTTGRLLAQSLGFNATEVSEIQKKNFLAKRIVDKIEKDREKILRRLDLMHQRRMNNPTDENEDAFDAVLDEVDAYNSKNYILPITGETITSSLAGKAENRAEAMEGLVVDPKLRPYVEDIVENSRTE